jgi:hypothetical protein
VVAPSDPEERIIRCIDAGLQVLGESAKHVIYHCLEKDFGLQKNEIPEKPEVFEQAITSIFGEEGSKVIEELVVQKLREAFKLSPKSKLTLLDAVLAVKTK